MSPFAIFATVLTVAYIIYYAFIITKDLYGTKGQHKNEGESIDVSGIADEDEPIAISEQPENEGYEDSQEYTEQVSEDGVRIYEPNNVPSNDAPASLDKNEPLTSNQLNEVHGENLEEIESGSSFSLSKVEFFDHLNKKHMENKRNITKEHVIDNL